MDNKTKLSTRSSFISDNALNNDSSQKKSILDPIIGASHDYENALDTYLHLDGRRYLNDQEIYYYFPNDSKEYSRQWREHFLIRHMWSGNFQAPIDKKLLRLGSVRVLDVGCGPGAWVIDMAREYPCSSFIGMDISPDFDNDKKLANTAFLQYNFLHNFPFQDNTFDFVRQSNILPFIPKKEWQEKTLKEMIRVTKSGGWIEISEVDWIYLNGGPITKRLNETLRKSLSPLGIDVIPSFYVNESLERVGGLQDISHAVQIQPIGEWKDTIGVMNLKNCLEAYDSMKTVLAPLMGVNDEEYVDLIRVYAVEVTEHRTLFSLHRYWAQKI
ncbi:6016_t:CDS:2 [Ambispora gerdemannii]|uniref:6016_t:CDS:1 n=1 Tax=Ambispora gerdemannii TaxID=144530 RepID=A0A9N9B7T6_9GLOM|nr:6016_t:CDS:2 [Ambispora gerdemannii]